MWQELIVVLIVVAATAFLSLRYKRTFQASKGGGSVGCGCGCSGCHEGDSEESSEQCELPEK